MDGVKCLEILAQHAENKTCALCISLISAYHIISRRCNDAGIAEKGAWSSTKLFSPAGTRTMHSVECPLKRLLSNSQIRLSAS